ncbi:uncharacterized protein PV07_12596 [Cladophialophora immunda]|uniref:Uncharacterized protein n=1 Tax=Cladophialophora immunda TaxID=569365 RepID=A0A0D2BSL6_9EURO|nr:uncharacterized protein PV07_12596 [Cladophialophora immunda]KIW22003.1 hypothetical protein PV07_12596 [Cladophialophora immunda]
MDSGPHDEVEERSQTFELGDVQKLASDYQLSRRDHGEIVQDWTWKQNYALITFELLTGAAFKYIHWKTKGVAVKMSEAMYCVPTPDTLCQSMDILPRQSSIHIKKGEDAKWHLLANGWRDDQLKEIPDWIDELIKLNMDGPISDIFRGREDPLPSFGLLSRISGFLGLFL